MATAFSQGDNGNLLSAITGATQSEAPSFAGFNPTLEDIQQERKKREIIKAVMPMLDFQNKMREVHPEITEEAIKGIPQGLNSGYKDISEYQQLAGVPIPQGQEQIDLARAGQFNLPEQDQNAAMVKTLMDKIKGGMTDIGKGFDDNTMNGFAFDNLQADPNKTGWNRVGEALGTGYRLFGNPAIQGLLAGAIYGKARGNGWEGLKYGVDWAQNKMKSDHYANLVGARPGILGGFGSEDYNAYSQGKRREMQNEIDQKRYEVYAADILDKIDWRAKNFDEKVREFALKYDLDERKLKETIRAHLANESIGRERNSISREGNAIRKQHYNDMKNNKSPFTSKQIFDIKNKFGELKTTNEQKKYVQNMASTMKVSKEQLNAIYDMVHDDGTPFNDEDALDILLDEE